MRILRAADRRAVPWKNGGGVTREIVGGPPGVDMGDFAWRVSLADVAADGPFSVFPGVDRILTMVEGAGMDLSLDGIGPRLVDTRHVPQHFPGDVPTGCRLLEGPVVNLNVMHRRGAVAAHVEVVRGDVLVGAPEGGIRIAIPLEGPAVLHRKAATPEPEPVPLEPYDAVVLTRQGPAPYDPPVTIVTAGRTAVITLLDG